MDETILKVLNGRATPSERETLAAWREQSPENEAYVRAMESVWAVTQEFAPRRAEDAPSASQVLGETPSAWTRRRAGKTRRFLVPAVAAASVVLGFGLARILVGPAAAVHSTPLEVVTAAGEMSTTRLPDGTVVRLSPGSRLRVGGDLGVRTVVMEGRAFFAVAHDRDYPFTIRSRGGEVRVLGTRLEVTALDDEFAVAVIEGQVAVSSGESHVVLAAGERTTSRAAKLEVESGYPSMPEWLGSFAAFQATPLSTVREEMAQRFGMTVVIEDPSIRARTVTAWFVDTSPEDIMRTICQVTDVRCTIAGNTTTIRRR
jgi:transmembrane sensor